ncbi:hypothetical protein, partial [Streptococcus mutans]|uniref:hypothetical protein n=2 Tax=Streptococcus mutans TaxID=1309 RepID=UPI001EE65D55
LKQLIKISKILKIERKKQMTNETYRTFFDSIIRKYIKWIIKCLLFIAVPVSVFLLIMDKVNFPYLGIETIFFIRIITVVIVALNLLVFLDRIMTIVANLRYISSQGLLDQSIPANQREEFKESLRFWPILLHFFDNRARDVLD